MAFRHRLRLTIYMRYPASSLSPPLQYPNPQHSLSSAWACWVSARHSGRRNMRPDTLALGCIKRRAFGAAVFVFDAGADVGCGSTSDIIIPLFNTRSWRLSGHRFWLGCRSGDSRILGTIAPSPHSDLDPARTYWPWVLSSPHMCVIASDGLLTRSSRDTYTADRHPGWSNLAAASTLSTLPMQ